MDSHEDIKQGKPACSKSVINLALNLWQYTCIWVSNYTLRFKEYKINVLLFRKKFWACIYYCTSSVLRRLKIMLFTDSNILLENSVRSLKPSCCSKIQGSCWQSKFIKLQTQQYHQRQDLLVSKHTEIEHPLSAGHHFQHHRQDDCKGGGRNHQQDTTICSLSAPLKFNAFLQCQPAETPGIECIPQKFLGVRAWLFCCFSRCKFVSRLCREIKPRMYNHKGSSSFSHRQYFVSHFWKKTNPKNRRDCCLAGWGEGKGQGREKYIWPYYMSQ